MPKEVPSFRVPINTSNKRIVLEGNMFKYQTANGLYLSSNNFNGTQQRFDLYSTTRSVSAANPAFSAYPVDYFKVYTNNTLMFTLSSFSTPQKLDIIYANPAGYRLASSGKRFSYIEIVSTLTPPNNQIVLLATLHNPS